MTDPRIVIAFSEPPQRFRFTRAMSGKCWVRTIDGVEWATKLGQELAAIGIHGVIKKHDPKIAREHARQSGKAVERDADRRARDALARANGDRSRFFAG